MTLTAQERQDLIPIVNEMVKLNADEQAIRWRKKEVAESAWDTCGVQASVVKQLAKEQAWDDVQREKQRQYEEALDHARAALGALLDTPLGQAAMISEENSLAEAAPPQHANGKSRNTRGRKKQQEAEVVAH